MKICRNCKTEKEEKMFHKHSFSPDGLAYICKDCANKRAIEWYYNNHKRCNEIKRDYYNKNKTALKNKIVGYTKERRKRFKSNLSFKLNHYFSCSIYSSLKNNKNGKRWCLLVGYTTKELIENIESKFSEGMSWDNYGEWHIDHKIPKVAFNFEYYTDIDFKRCWSLDNLQPLWKHDNCSKNDRLEKPFQPSLLISI